MCWPSHPQSSPPSRRITVALRRTPSVPDTASMISGGYEEPNWFGGGSIPVVFPHIAIPQFSLRYKPIPEMEARLSLGFSITGFWFGLSADYGQPQPKEGDPESVKKTGVSIHRDRL